ncbi:MAG TPA: sugar phosphate nucleotidyltransferase, partial [Bacteroidales bacterium]|nr:sugar phosphate nucleotidyltransferase [Bacteroidales bacterium]
KRSGVTKAYLCVNHFAELIMAFLGDGSKLGLEIQYVSEDKPLGTVAPIKLISDLPDDFLVMNGDLLTDLNYRELYDMHLASAALLTVSTYQRTTKIDFGVLDLDESKKIVTGFREKPVYNFEVSMGVYAMNRKVLDFVPYNTPFGFDDLMLRLLEKKMPININRFSGYWLDIGRPEDYEKACIDYENNPML